MADKPKMFLCLKRGPMLIQLIPQTGSGWMAMGLWILGFLVMLGGFLFLSQSDSGDIPASSMPIFAILVSVWAIAMIVWTYRHSDVIEIHDLREFAEWKREKDAKSKRR